MFGDPTFLGWSTTFFYFIVACFCFLVRSIEPLEISPHEEKNTSYRKLWWILSVFLIVLGLNKQLDVQTVITEFGKEIVLDAGWYGNRKMIQILFVSILGLAAISGSVLAAYRLKNSCRTVQIALGGFILLLAFVVLRAASFNKVDQLSGFGVSGVNFHWIAELSSLLIIAIATIRFRKKHL